MEYTEQQKTEFKASFARKFRAQIFVAIAVVVATLVIVTLGANADRSIGAQQPSWVFAPVLAVVIGAIVFSLRNWRCPACNSYLGRSFVMNFCPKCGVPLR